MWGNGTTKLDRVALTANGLSVNNGTFALPTIVLADGALALEGARANLTYDGTQYRVGGEGRLTLSLPGNAGQTNTIAFTLSPDGSITGESPGLTLNLGVTSLEMGQTLASASGVTAASVTLTLAPELGDVSFKATDVSVTPNGLTTGDLMLSASVPSIGLGRGKLVDNKVSVARLRAESGEGVYALVLDGTLDAGSGPKPMRVILNTGKPIEVESDSRLQFRVGGLSFTLLPR